MVAICSLCYTDCFRHWLQEVFCWRLKTGELTTSHCCLKALRVNGMKQSHLFSPWNDIDEFSLFINFER